VSGPAFRTHNGCSGPARPVIGARMCIMITLQGFWSAKISTAMKHLAVLTTAIAMGWFASSSSTAFADDCDRNQALLLDHRDGRMDAGEVRFSYDSRVEKFSSTARKFAWCIEADRNNQNIAEFHWGDPQHDGKYLNTLIEPGRGALSTTTDASQKIEGQRTIRFRRKNKPDWGAIAPATLSSRNFGFYSDLKLIFAQANSPAQPWLHRSLRSTVIRRA
jgi:hypothetical protein